MSAVKSIVRLTLVVAALATAACADSMTAPSRMPASVKANRDTTVGTLADTLNCRAGWVIMDGRVICDESH
jgi:hypothetical protein